MLLKVHCALAKGTAKRQARRQNTRCRPTRSRNQWPARSQKPGKYPNSRDGTNVLRC